MIDLHRGAEAVANAEAVKVIVIEVECLQNGVAQGAEHQVRRDGDALPHFAQRNLEDENALRAGRLRQREVLAPLREERLKQLLPLAKRRRRQIIYFARFALAFIVLLFRNEKTGFRQSK